MSSLKAFILKKLTPLLMLSLCGLSASAQKPPPPKERMAGTSDLNRKDKRVEQITLGKKKFTIYCGPQAPNRELRQENGDSLLVYKITAPGATYSILEIPKLATRKGKIIGEGSYKVAKDTLYVYINSYDYIGAYRLTNTYVSDKYGLKKIADHMEAIKYESITEEYLKPAEMKTIFPAK